MSITWDVALQKVMRNNAPLQVITVEEAEAQAYLGQLLVDWIAHCGAASVLLGVSDAVHASRTIRDALTIDIARCRLRIQRATTPSPPSQQVAAHATHAFMC